MRFDTLADDASHDMGFGRYVHVDVIWNWVPGRFSRKSILPFLSCGWIKQIWMRFWSKMVSNVLQRLTILQVQEASNDGTDRHGRRNHCTNKKVNGESLQFVTYGIKNAHQQCARVMWFKEF